MFFNKYMEGERTDWGCFSCFYPSTIYESPVLGSIYTGQ